MRTVAGWLRRIADRLDRPKVRVPSVAEGLTALRARELTRSEADNLIALVNSRVRRGSWLDDYECCGRMIGEIHRTGCPRRTARFTPVPRFRTNSPEDTR